MDEINIFSEAECGNGTAAVSVPVVPIREMVRLRERIHESAFNDSVDTRITLLTELIFGTYIHNLQLHRGFEK
jgi:hypothetical protein